MGLVRGMTTTRATKQKKNLKRPSNDHEVFLKRMGAHPDQRGRTTGVNKIPSYKTTETAPLSNRIMFIDPKQGMTPEEKIAYTRTVQLGQMYNKGGLQVVGREDDINTGKRRV
jgi:hypothetical protein